MLPTKGEVFTFITTRTKYGGFSQSGAIADAAEKVNKIWKNADVCPMSKEGIIKRCVTLLKDRSYFLNKLQKEKNLNHTSLPSPSPSEFTRKRRLPSTSRQPSRRVSTSKFKRCVTKSAFEDGAISEDVSALLSEIVDKIVNIEIEKKSDIPCRINLRADSSAEQRWLSQVGCDLFDVFSEHERVKVITNGYAFDEEFLADQRGPRKLRMDTSKVTEEFELDLSQRSERERRHKNYIASATMDFSVISTDLDSTSDEPGEVLQDSLSDIGEIQYISAVRTRSTKSLDVEAAVLGTSKRSIASQTDDSLFPTVSTRIYSKKNKTTSR